MWKIEKSLEFKPNFIAESINFLSNYFPEIIFYFFSRAEKCKMLLYKLLFYVIKLNKNLIKSIVFQTLKI